ncbi:RRNA-processing protein UTP23 [Ceratobasidium theobromae]|uniref:rRNA-processing protein UTP23 n=1 Tax=Ceratobasidium theobromae TaxID=1582974 RepID=A0A5N5QVW9_9AGAM|nr:RRNA-processing protein UTP23 [Ceratobasidium theobromae]
MRARIYISIESEDASMSVRESEARVLASTSTPILAGPIHRRKIAKGPNPLSMKKKKSNPATNELKKQMIKPNAPAPKTPKRKRDSYESNEGSQRDGNTTGYQSQQEPTSGGHKRKRRRKTDKVQAA